MTPRGHKKIIVTIPMIDFKGNQIKKMQYSLWKIIDIIELKSWLSKATNISERSKTDSKMFDHINQWLRYISFVRKNWGYKRVVTVSL